MQSDQDLVLRGPRSCYFPELQHIHWRPVSCNYNGFQRVTPPWTCEKSSIVAVGDEIWFSEGITMNVCRRFGRFVYLRFQLARYRRVAFPGWSFLDTHFGVLALVSITAV